MSQQLCSSQFTPCPPSTADEPAGYYYSTLKRHCANSGGNKFIGEDIGAEFNNGLRFESADDDLQPAA